MKKLILTSILGAAALVSVNAQETIKTLYTGEPVDVTWSNTLKIEADNFGDDVKVGDYIYVTFTKTTDVIELKGNGTWLPGTKYTVLGDNTTDLRTYITADMLTALREYGLELCGASFTVSEVSICNDGFEMPEGAIWGGYFWVDNWNTLELFKTAFDNYDGQRYMDIYLSDDNGDYTGYFMKVLTAWENPDAIWADNDRIVHEGKKAIVDLKGIDVKNKLADVNTLMIQSNPEGGSPYNITAIALRAEEGSTTVVDNICSDPMADIADVYNLQGILVLKNASLTLDLGKLPAGIYIANGKKISVK
ncbi:MAG: hypothetical protein NC418_10980 [Muribaculaceae bacterium]|nr:hypothetical protein [Muribaculaceae bacterium]